MADAFCKTTQDSSEDNSGNASPQREDQPTIQGNAHQGVYDDFTDLFQYLSDFNSNNTLPQQRHQSPTEPVSAEFISTSPQHGDNSPMESEPIQLNNTPLQNGDYLQMELEPTESNNTSPVRGMDLPMESANPNSSAFKHVETNHDLIQHSVGTPGHNSFVNGSAEHSTREHQAENHVALVEPRAKGPGISTSSGTIAQEEVIEITIGETEESIATFETNRNSLDTHSNRVIPNGSDHLISGPIIPVPGPSPSSAGVNRYADPVEASRLLSQLNLTTPGHIPPVTGSNPVEWGSMCCTVCKTPFTNQQDFEEHRSRRMQDPSPVQPCTGGVLHKCPKLNNCSPRCDQLARYVQPHTNKGPHLCQTCGKGFTRAYSLVKHMRIHTGEKPYVCAVCGEAFGYASCLMSHKLIHTGEKPYKCNVCPREFRQSSHLTRHTRTHTGEKPYQCPRCPKAFSDRSSLKRHEGIQHPEQKL